MKQNQKSASTLKTLTLFLSFLFSNPEFLNNNGAVARLSCDNSFYSFYGGEGLRTIELFNELPIIFITYI